MFTLTLLLLAQMRPAPLPDIPSLEIRRATSRPVIDGRLDDAAWANSQAVTFQFPWPNQTGAKQKTTARLLWDDQYLYIAYECEDADITAQYTHRDDPTYKDDAVEAFINPRPSQQELYIGFEMNARAVMYDYAMVLGRANFKRFDTQRFELATHLNGTLNTTGDTDKGWSLEVAIPFSEFDPLGKTPAPGETWTINLNRWDGTEPNRRLSQWSDSGLVAPNPHNPVRFGRATFVSAPPRSSNP